MKKIVLATKNKDKVKEIKAIFAKLPAEILSLADFAELPDAVEDGKTFQENATLKAKFFSDKLKLACLADDSGLEVEALNGLPGIYSARFSGYHADDDTNNQKLLEELNKVGVEESKANYTCAISFIDTDGTELHAEGKIDGVIKKFAKGTGGFGYDPYFYIDDAKTMAELTAEEKNLISHRGMALRKLLPKLKERFL